MGSVQLSVAHKPAIQTQASGDALWYWAHPYGPERYGTAHI